MKTEPILEAIPSFLILILLLFSGSKGLFAFLTIILGSVVVLIILLLQHLQYSEMMSHNLRYVIRLIGSVLPLIGMIFANFTAPFDLGVPFGYYFIVSFLVIIQLLLSLIAKSDFNKMSNTSERTKKATENSLD